MLRRWKRTWAWVIAVVMVFTLFPGPGFQKIEGQAAASSGEWQDGYIIEAGAERTVAEALEELTDSQIEEGQGNITIKLTGNTKDSADIFLPRDRNLEHVTLTSVDGTDYKLGSTPVDFYANGIPFRLEHGTLCNLFGGGENAVLDRTELLITGGAFYGVPAPTSGLIVGGSVASAKGADVSVTDSCNIKILNCSNLKASNIYGGSFTDAGNVQANIGDTNITVKNSKVETCVITGGSYVWGAPTGNVSLDLGSSNLTFQNSEMEIGYLDWTSSIFGGHMGNDEVENLKMNCDSTNIKVLDTKIISDGFGGGEIFGGSYDTDRDGTDEVTVGSSNIVVRNSEVHGVWGGGAYFEKCTAKTGTSNVQMENSTVKPSTGVDIPLVCGGGICLQDEDYQAGPEIGTSNITVSGSLAADSDEDDRVAVWAEGLLQIDDSMSSVPPEKANLELDAKALEQLEKLDLDSGWTGVVLNFASGRKGTVSEYENYQNLLHKIGNAVIWDGLLDTAVTGETEISAVIEAKDIADPVLPDGAELSETELEAMKQQALSDLYEGIEEGTASPDQNLRQLLMKMEALEVSGDDLLSVYLKVQLEAADLASRMEEENLIVYPEVFDFSVTPYYQIIHADQTKEDAAAFDAETLKNRKLDVVFKIPESIISERATVTHIMPDGTKGRVQDLKISGEKGEREGRFIMDQPGTFRIAFEKAEEPDIPDPDVPDLKTLKITPEKVTLEEGETKKLTVTADPPEMLKDPEWNSSDEDVASVDNRGTVTAGSAGTAVITVSCGEITAECRVTVKRTEETVKLDSLTITPEELELERDEEQTLVLIASPSDAVYDPVKWSSSKPEIVSVTKDGVVRGKKDGKAVITASAGNLTAKCHVTVNKRVEGYEIFLDAEEITMKAGRLRPLTYEIYPADDNLKVQWESSDTSVATVDADGMITAKKEGTTYIRAAIEGSEAEAECAVTVERPQRLSTGGVKDMLKKEELKKVLNAGEDEELSEDDVRKAADTFLEQIPAADDTDQLNQNGGAAALLMDSVEKLEKKMAETGVLVSASSIEADESARELFREDPKEQGEIYGAALNAYERHGAEEGSFAELRISVFEEEMNLPEKVKNKKLDEETILPLEISLVDQDGETFESLKVPVKVVLPLPKGYSRQDSIYILHYLSDGSIDVIPVKVKNNRMEFTVSEFSPFIVTRIKSAVHPVEEKAETDSGNDDWAVKGKWMQNENGWWYRYDDGTWPENQIVCLEYKKSYDWYYFGGSGYIKTGWQNIGNDWYYFHEYADGSRGRMYTGWNQIDGIWYYFETAEGSNHGKLYRNRTTPDGYPVNENGEFVS